MYETISVIEPPPGLPKLGEEVHSQEAKIEYEIIKVLGQGTFGLVYLARRRGDGRQFAMKCEHMAVKRRFIKLECGVLEAAFNIQSPHFCKVIDKGAVADRFNFFTMTLLGPNIWHLRRDRKHQRFSINTALKVAEQTLQAIRDLHRIGWLHRDIKPLNFTIGRDEESHTIFIIDFGMARCFKQDGKEIRNPRLYCPWRGTGRYAPLTAHRHEEQSRRDDVESWLYMMIELTSGKLPWKACKGAERDKMRALKADSRDKLRSQLFEGCPVQAYSRILTYLDKLDYKDIPDYDYVWKMLDIAREENGLSYCDPVDWDPSQPYHGARYVPERKFD
ncbi:unnamed protein product, partial [Mesorhabditis spiculigera]